MSNFVTVQRWLTQKQRNSSPVFIDWAQYGCRDAVLRALKLKPRVLRNVVLERWFLLSLRMVYSASAGFGLNSNKPRWPKKCSTRVKYLNGYASEMGNGLNNSEWNRRKNRQVRRCFSAKTPVSMKNDFAFKRNVPDSECSYISATLQVRTRIDHFGWPDLCV